MLDELVRRITASVTPITDEYEIILVNDQSPDDSWNVIKKICKDEGREPFSQLRAALCY